MQAIKIVVWEEDGAWLGYLQEHPDYWTQGATRDDLHEHLKACTTTSPAVRFPESGGWRSW